MTTSDQRLYWEDFAVGEPLEFGAAQVTADDITAFAREFDPDPSHLDGTAGGRLTASDWHSCAMLMRMMCDDYLCRAAGAGAPGVEHVKWFAPVRPGDVLGVRRTPLEVRASKSRPRIGIVRMLLDVFNQHGEKVMSWLPVQLYDRRDPSAEPPPPASIPLPPDDANAFRPPNFAPPQAGRLIGAFEDIAIGEETALGSHTFTTRDMLHYATRFNPQYFHADEAAAKASLYGGLIASGWHNAAVWNRLAVENRLAAREKSPPADGERHAEIGPAIAVLDMKWPMPVRPGDTITYRARITGKHVDPATPAWGIVESLNEGVNQRGETVLSLNHRIWAERRAPAAAIPSKNR